MTNIIINEKNKSLMVTKKFAAAAERFGSDEYAELKAARTDFPTFKVVVKTTKSKNKFKGLTYDFMERYISTRENAESEKEEYKSKKKKLENQLDVNVYNEMKKWFIERYPEVMPAA